MFDNEDPFETPSRSGGKIRLDYIIEDPDYERKLAEALDTSNVTVKKHIFDLLTALCVHNDAGLNKAFSTLQEYKKLKNERYRLRLVVNELAQTRDVTYQTALLSFINCAIISTRALTDRVRLRNEFIGLNLLSVLNNIRYNFARNADISVQLDVFQENKDSDDAQTIQGPNDVDLSCHLDVFYAILRQVAGSPQETPFLNVLQHLLRVDPREPISDIVWDTAERLVHRATLVENREDAVRLLRSPSAQTKVICQCQKSQNVRKGSISATGSTPSSPSSPPAPPMPPIPPVPPPLPIYKEDDHPQQLGASSSGITLPNPIVSKIPPPPPPSTSTFSTRVVKPTVEMEDLDAKRLPQQETPVPRTKMKTINWNKIPNNKVVGKNNIWNLVASDHENVPPATTVDWQEIEDLFCQQAPTSCNSSPKLGNRDYAYDDRKRKDNEITLLDGKRSLNVNIFLKQFKSTNENIIELIRDGEHEAIGGEKLRGLLKILPEVDELDMLKSFSGDFNKLGNAEKFLLQLIRITNYKLRIEGMLLKEEFASNMNYLEPCINAMMLASQDLMTNKRLQEVLYMVLITGNFLNSGGYAGNAAGVKLASLQKITDIRANKPNMTLLHVVALQAEKKSKDLTKFHEDMRYLEEASKTTVEQLKNEINTLDVRIRKIRKQIDMTLTEVDIKSQMAEFLKLAERDVSRLQRDMTQLESIRVRLADFFCEDASTFKLEECFRIFHNFCTKFKQALVDNTRRRLLEEQACIRRKQREELLAYKRRQMNSQVSTPDSELLSHMFAENDMRGGFQTRKIPRIISSNLDANITSEEDLSISGSPSVARRRLESFNDRIDPFDRSPDVTPNGSLRRRKSRVLSEEDEGELMDYLKTSGLDSLSRERKSWGSLDRSWGKRIRPVQRKRPALLGIDLSGERERSTSPSPSPVVEVKDVSGDASRKPKEWRQKIESWLQSSDENGKKENLEVKERRETKGSPGMARRSFEVDSGSEVSSTLDTVHEDKLSKFTPSLCSQYKSTKETRKSPPKEVEQNKDKEIQKRQETIRRLNSPETLTLYIRSPSRPADPEPPIQHNKVEIDSDNIETPPSSRRTFTSIVDPNERRRRSKSREETDATVLGDGQFDRFSPARRTRRYKKNSTDSDVNDGSGSEDTKDHKKDLDMDARLKRWQERLKNHPIDEDVDVDKNVTIEEKIPKEDPPVEQKIKTSTIEIRLRLKTRDHDNDEGFEETQSLMSESPSQGASSGAYEDPNTTPTQLKTINFNAKKPTKVIPRNLCIQKPAPSIAAITNRLYQKTNTPVVKPRLRVKPLDSATKLTKRPSDTELKDKPEVKVTRIKPAPKLSKFQGSFVEKSNSRSSLMSSRSSLNSSASINTVKRAPIATKTSLTSHTKRMIDGRTLSKKLSKESLPRSNFASGLGAKPPRPTASTAPTFMKPTTASATKITRTQPVTPYRVNSFR